MARQSSRKRQRPLQDGLQQKSRVKKKAKTGDQHHEIQTNLAVADQQSQRQAQRPDPASPPSPPSPPWSLPAQSEIGPSANAPPLKLTTKNLRAFDKTWRARLRARRHSNGHPLSDESGQTKVTVLSEQTKETTVSGSTKSKRSRAYNAAFAQILRDCGIYSNGDPSLLANLEELRGERDVRPSLEPSVYPDKRVQYYINKNAKALTELGTERGFVPAILGECELPEGSNITWSNLSSMTKDQTVAPQPDLYYGLPVDDIDMSLRERIGSLIIPYIRDGAPGAPYLVFETKGPEGSFEVLKRQATYGSAAAARAQFALENFGLDQPVYDNRVLAHAWTFFSSPGDLTHYGVRVSAPRPGTSRPGYHMTHIKRYRLTESYEQYRAGLTAFRNCRDEAYKAAQARLDTAHERLRRILSPQVETCVPAGALPPLPEAQYEDVDDDGYLAASRAPEIPNDVDGGDTDGLSDSARLLQEQLQEEYQAWFARSNPPLLNNSDGHDGLDVGVDLPPAPPPDDGPTTYSTMSRPRRRTRAPKRHPSTALRTAA